ncbi:MAG: BMC domain-containing protein [Acidobacteria bacterium]|nr:BMC domain-containing protein [Acidobacteriota bacterium]
MEPALALLEFESIALGIRAGDAMAKRTPLKTLHCGTVHPGKYLVLAAGGVGEVEEAILAAEEAGPAAISARVFLPAVHEEVVRGLCGGRRDPSGSALGVVETRTVPAVLDFTDAALKGAGVSLQQLALADGLGGKGYALLLGEVHDVEAAFASGLERLGGEGDLVARVLIPQIRPEMLANLEGSGRFLEELPPPGEA